MARTIGEGINEGMAALMNARQIRMQAEQQKMNNLLTQAKIQEAGYQIGPGGQLTERPGFEDWSKRKEKADVLLKETQLPLYQLFTEQLRQNMQPAMSASTPAVMTEKNRESMDYSGQPSDEPEGTILDDDETGESYQVINGILERI